VVPDPVTVEPFTTKCADATGPPALGVAAGVGVPEALGVAVAAWLGVAVGVAELGGCDDRGDGVAVGPLAAICVGALVAAWVGTPVETCVGVDGAGPPEPPPPQPASMIDAARTMRLPIVFTVSSPVP
jgi:hypothetical protein